MKKIKFIVVMIVVLAMVMAFVGCTEQEAVVSETTETTETTETSETIEPEAVESNNAADSTDTSVLSYLEWTVVPDDVEVPEGYAIVEDDIILSSLEYPVYCIENKDGSLGYIAYANKITEDGEILSSDWYVFVRFGNVVFVDVPHDVEVPEDHTLCDTVELDNGMTYGFGLYANNNEPNVRFVYGMLYDAQTGKFVKSDWFEIMGDNNEPNIDGNNITVVEENVSNGTVEKSEVVVNVPKNENIDTEQNPADSIKPEEDKQDTKPSTDNTQPPTGGSTGSPSKPSTSGGTSSGSTTPTTPSEPTGHWETVEKIIYEDIYEEKWVTLCNTCGADITTSLSEHGKMHMLKDENFSYHDDEIKVKVGTKEVVVTEQVWVED